MRVLVDGIPISWPKQIIIEVDQPGEIATAVEVLVKGGVLFVVGQPPGGVGLTVRGDTDKQIIFLNGRFANLSLDQLFQVPIELPPGDIIYNPATGEIWGNYNPI